LENSGRLGEESNKTKLKKRGRNVRRAEYVNEREREGK
jgi:hypothetical protein